MATFISSDWSYGAWAARVDADAFDVQVGDLLSSVLDGQLQVVNDSLITGGFDPNWVVSVYGQGFVNARTEQDIHVYQISASSNLGNFEMRGALTGGGSLGAQGSISYIRIDLADLDYVLQGDVRIGALGQVLPFNCTEDLQFANGVTARFQTDSMGRYARLRFTKGVSTLDMDGAWDPALLRSYADLFSGGDVVNGSARQDFLQGYAGDDRLLGQGGMDYAVFQGARADYSLTRLNSQEWQVRDHWFGRDGTDTLQDVERVVFSDKAVALDPAQDGVAAMAYRLYKAAFDRTPDDQGLGFWIAKMDEGMDLIEVSARFIDSAEFRGMYGYNPSAGQFLTNVYAHVLDRVPDAGGYAWWLDQMEHNPEKTWQKVLADFSESPENQANVVGLIGSGVVYDLWV